jgi:hypothetical protein
MNDTGFVVSQQQFSCTLFRARTPVGKVKELAKIPFFPYLRKETDLPMALTILEQSHLFLETLTKNTETKHIHYIVKTTPFNIRFGLSGATALNFQSCALSCTLVYDLPNKKEVEAVGGKPLEYVVHPSADGRACTVDFRIKVLTTQHQNNFFLIRVCLEGRTDTLEVYTHPIKSVSKPEQIRRRQSLQQAKEEEKPAVSKKRARGEELLAALDDMRMVQQQQSEVLAVLLQNQIQALAVPPSMTPAFSGSTPSVEEAMALLIRAYEAEAPEERPTKIRKIAHTFPAKDQQLLEDFGRHLTCFRASPPPPATRVVPPTQSIPPPVSSCPMSEFTSNPLPSLFGDLDLGFDPTTLSTDDWAQIRDLSGWISGH